MDLQVEATKIVRKREGQLYDPLRLLQGMEGDQKERVEIEEIAEEQEEDIPLVLLPQDQPRVHLRPHEGTSTNSQQQCLEEETVA